MIKKIHRSNFLIFSNLRAAFSVSENVTLKWSVKQEIRDANEIGLIE